MQEEVFESGVPQGAPIDLPKGPAGPLSSQSSLGWMYAYGLGITKDEREAVKWYRKAAEQGIAAAQANLGWMLANGLGVTKDEREAVRWYRKAAGQGHEIARTILTKLGEK